MATAKLTGTLLYAERESTGDVTFVVDTKRIRAHKNVLSAFSAKYKAQVNNINSINPDIKFVVFLYLMIFSYFILNIIYKTQFYGVRPDRGRIHVKDISAEAFEEFIKFFYGETINFTLENIESILNQAKQCLINIFVYECESFLMECITQKRKSALWGYRLSLLYELETLQSFCEQEIRNYVPMIFATTDFLECDLNILVNILSLERFVDCKESDIFDACISWARAACRRKNIDDKNPTNLRAQLGSALKCICFGSFNIYKFVEMNEAYKGFFTPDEFIEITNIIGELKNFRSVNFNQRIRMHGLECDANYTEIGSISNGNTPSARKRRYVIGDGFVMYS